MLNKKLYIGILFFLTACGGEYNSSSEGLLSETPAGNNCTGPGCVDTEVPPPVTDTLPANAKLVASASELTTALQNAVAGDTIALASGTYGNLVVSNRNFSQNVTIRPQMNAVPVFKSLRVQSSSHLVFSGLTFSPRKASGDSMGDAVSLNGQDIIFEKSLITFADDTTSWSAARWVNETGNGISAGGTRITIRDNVLRNLGFGISVGATNSLVARNKVKDFRGDALRGLGDNTTFEYNDVRNCYQVDDNHMDGFQSWSLGSTGSVGTGVVTGITLRGNYFTDHENQSHPLKCNLQAIGLFDGMFKDWVVENNVIVTNHYHAISFYGAINVKIVNNTVIDPNLTDTIRPWIMITNHKNGTVSSGSVIRNNISPSVNAGTETAASNNLISNSGNLAQIFENPAQLDYRLKIGGLAIDTGTSLNAPALDFMGLSRLVGGGVDIGAYEYR